MGADRRDRLWSDLSIGHVAIRGRSISVWLAARRLRRRVSGVLVPPDFALGASELIGRAWSSGSGMTYVRYIGLRLAAFWLGALVAAAYFPLVFLVQAIDDRLWPVALTVEIALLFGAMILVRQANLSYAWPVLGLPVGFVVAWVVSFIILVSIYGWGGD